MLQHAGKRALLIGFFIINLISVNSFKILWFCFGDVKSRKIDNKKK